MAGSVLTQIYREKQVEELAMDGVDEIPQQFDITIYKPPTAIKAIAANSNLKNQSIPFIDPPVIDFARLITSNEEELEKYREALSSWGCFQLINHGMESIIDEMRKNAKQFFQLPMEEKLKCAKSANYYEGYGNDDVTGAQAKDWTDRLFLIASPEEQRKMHLWPQNPPSLRKTIDECTKSGMNMIETLIKIAAKSIGLEENIFLSKCGEKPVAHFRLNLYPPCPKPELVLGLKQHTDGGVMTLILPDEQVGGFEFIKDDQWYQVHPRPGAIEINIGDQFEVLSNGIFKSVLHRVVANKKERMSIVLLWSPDREVGVGPIDELINEKRPRLYKSVKNYNDIIIEAWKKGIFTLDAMKL
ncbi:hypothetical protein M9H77_06249 [Catharanthus roseus]|uniref:Uncharacterized protein n=1 Tax=Catharanthus roseus TaxID=4058 RepID=A0ACC0BRP8_CATRO|nr:hypothetical protein M9H77_06249 [Catharanthus roseus]